MTTARKAFWEKFYQNPHGHVSDVYEKRGEVHRLIGKYDKALFDFKFMRSINQKVTNEKKEVDALIAIGIVQTTKGKYDEAERNFTAALKITKINNLEKVATCYRHMGKILQLKEKYNEALDLYNKALKIYDNLNNEHGKHLVLEYMASNYRLEKKYTEALSVFGQLLEFYQKGSNKVRLSHAYQEYGNIYRKIGNKDKATEYYNRAYFLIKETGAQDAMAHLLCNMGLIDFEENKFISAKEYFKQSVKLAEKCGMIYIMAVSLLNLSDAYNKLNEKSMAKICIERVLSMDIKIEGIKQEAQRVLNEINSNEGR